MKHNPRQGKGKKAHKEQAPQQEDIRLNKYIANSGVCSRREADKLITAGEITVNGNIVTEMGYRVSKTDKVTYRGKTLNPEENIYLLLNKPKDYITTSDDPQERKTVIELIKSACKERIYPVGRLDRNTTGVLLFTNDGELTKKLTHPSHQVRKIYHVFLNKKFKTGDLDKLRNGVELEDGLMKADEIAFADPNGDKAQVGIEIHSGKNRIVRRMFEHLGYEVVKLDRVYFAGLTKKDIPRGKYRFLSPKEIQFLKMIK